MKEIIGWILAIIVCAGIIGFCNNIQDTKCIKAHGQIITHTTKLGNSCVYPAK